MTVEQRGVVNVEFITGSQSDEISEANNIM